MDSNVIRAPSLRRGKNDERLCDRIKLKKVLGLTVCSNAALDVSPTTGILAYPAGCTVVLFNAKKLQQSHLLNTSKKTITAVAYSHCGRYIATGECGINPAIKVWELDNQNDAHNDNSSGGTVISEFLGHKYAVTCVAFSPTGKYLVSVGSQHDMIVNVFDWKLNLKIASNKVSAKVSAVSFSEDGNYFVTVGNRHVKFWYLEGNRKYKEPIPLMGRSAILGELRNNDFCAVACGKGESADSTYAITRVGHLVEFNSRRLLDKWVACRTTLANCICVTANYILVGCSEAIIRIFNSLTLEYITTLPRTHYLGVDVAQGIHINHIMNVPQNAKYPDTVAMVFDETRLKVTCVYNDHSLYIWDLRDIKRVGKSHSFLYHSACIWGVETVPSSLLLNNSNSVDSSIKSTLPDDSFLTCSSDDTIRVWGLDGCQNNEMYRKNIYSKELLKIVYIDEDLNFIKDVDNPIVSADKSSTYDGRNGVRCIKISPDRSHLASGDRSGNIRIYNLSNLKMITMIEAHDSEVLCLEYTNEKISRKLLASASRDRLIHVFDVMQSYKILQTLDDHSSSITSIKFLGNGLNFQMISCGADKSIVFRTFQNNIFSRGTNCSGKTTLYDMEIDSNAKHILTACQDRNIRVYGTQSGKHTKTFKGSHSDEGSLIKISLDPSGIYIATSCTDKTLSVYDYYSNECMARMYGHSELVTGLKFTNDCRHLISASGDGCVFIWQVPHDMVVTMQARLSQQRIRSGQMPLVSRPISNVVAFDTTYTMTQQQHQKFENERIDSFISEPTLSPGYKLSEVGQLPQWAKRKNSESEISTHQQQQQQQQQQQRNQQTQNSISNNHNSQQILPAVPKPRGRWAQRGGQGVDVDTMETKSPQPEIITPSTTPLNATTPTFNFTINNGNSIQTSDYNSASSKEICFQASSYLSEDSSLDSGLENRRKTERRLSEQKRKSQILRFEANNDNDGDVEDISDGERTSSDHGMMFYPTAIPGTPTEFKVNAMNEDELRKSMRRKHFEKVGLSLNTHSAASTGTGTSDTEDEGSTPSGENAERSLASTLGGSTENLPQQSSSSFLQSALDGPGNLADRQNRNRRSISAKHNTQQNQNSSLTYSKSYTNSKKEELMKVINEAKQKLEDVGYRSNLRGSLSVSDLSHSNPFDSSRINRFNKLGDSNASTCINSNNKNNLSSCSYFNCAAPKSILTQNCNIIRQLQKNYPPYPYEIGTYDNNCHSNKSNQNEEPSQQPTSNTKHRPNYLDLKPSSRPASSYCHSKQIQQQHFKSALKNHQSCPVSPVHEEMDWKSFPCDSTSNQYNFMNSNKKDQKQQRSQSNRHSVYSDDAKTILDMIHSDTEKMIAEITEKYGDLDSYNTEKCVKEDYEVLKTPTNATAESLQIQKLKDDAAAEERDTFSSDSLEDCSLSFDIDKCDNTTGQRRHKFVKNKKTICKKHAQSTQHGTKQKINKTLPTRSVSDYFIYPEFYSRCPSRNVSLSDILDDCEKEENQQQQQQHQTNPFLRSDRHSSASFFLCQYPERKSQDSILSDDFSNTSLYNSMDSILSDESDCKSAPLEVLFTRANIKRDYYQYLSYDSNQERYSGNELISKSYGSSPNNLNNFDFYMQNRECLYQENTRFCQTNEYDELRNVYESNDYQQQISKSKFGITTSNTFPVVSNSSKLPINLEFIDISTPDDYDNIPTMVNKNEEYSLAMNRSIRKEFANQRQSNNTNPLFSEIASDQNFGVTKQNSIAMKKSCSFDVDMSDCRKISQYAPTRFEKNLRKFEKDQKHLNSRHTQSHSLKSSPANTLEMDYVPHKPPVAARRSSSMRSRSKTRSKTRYNTVDQIDMSEIPVKNEARDFVNPNVTTPSELKKNKSEEKIFEMFISETGCNDNDNMDSLELYTKPDLFKVNSVDSLDDPVTVTNTPSKEETNIHEKRSFNPHAQFEDIEKKINVINKLLKMEELKMEQERLEHDNRMKPIAECNTKQKGYVKNLTKNFDQLVKNIQEEIEYEKNQRQLLAQNQKVKRNYSLPDVLEGAKLRNFSDFQKIETSSSRTDQRNPKKMEQKEMMTQDDNMDNNDNYSCSGNKNSTNGTNCCNARENEGNNPKSLLSVHNDDSSIRRACSLSDLCVGKGFSNSNNTNVTPQKSNSTSSNNRSNTRSSGKRTVTLNHKSNNNMGSRSISVGVLNQGSDSETDTLESRELGSHMYPTPANRTSFPTVSSRQHTKSGTTNSNRRKTISVSSSSVNLSTTGQDDSSSEENQTPINTHPTKPIVPPRPRNLLLNDHKKIIQSNGGTSIAQTVAKLRDNGGGNCSDSTSQLCTNIISMLTTTTNAVLQLHSRLKSNEEENGTKDNYLLLKELENAVIMTQNMLTRITNNKNDTSSHIPLSITTPNNDPMMGLENSDYLTMMNKCADILNRVRNNKNEDFTNDNQQK